MKVIKISGRAGSGKTRTLQHLAATLGGDVVTGYEFRLTWNRVKANLEALPLHSFVDEASPTLVRELTDKERTRSNTDQVIYVVCSTTQFE